MDFVQGGTYVSSMYRHRGVDGGQRDVDRRGCGARSEDGSRKEEWDKQKLDKRDGKEQ
jgi:hypothetical protein